MKLSEKELKELKYLLGNTNLNDYPNLLEFKKTDNKQLYNLINLIYKEFK